VAAGCAAAGAADADAVALHEFAERPGTMPGCDGFGSPIEVSLASKAR
jgi:hypothetical protein